MMIDNQLSQSWELKIKSIFVDCMIKDDNELFLGGFTDKMVDFLLELLMVDEIACYFNDPWKHSLYLEKVAASPHRHNQFASTISIDTLLNSSRKELCAEACLSINETLHSLGIPVYHEGEILGLFVVISEDKGLRNYHKVDLSELRKVIGELLKKAIDISDRKKEEKRYKLLQRITTEFHSAMNMHSVLVEVIETLREVCPSFVYYLLMSQDSDNTLNLPIKSLEMDGENLSAMQAYVSGRVQFEDLVEEKKSVLYAPLLGKQGVYGVLQVIVPETVIFPDNEVEFISLLANTAGGALENAQLYEQSKRLIADLRLINETSHRLNSNLRLNETVSYMRHQINKFFLADEVGFFMIQNGQTKLVPGSSSFFNEEASSHYIQYVKSSLEQDREALYIGDMDSDKVGQDGCYKSLMAFPMIDSGKMDGFCIVLHRDAYHFTFDMFKLMQSLIHHSSMAFVNSMLREKLEKMVITDYLTGLYSRNYLEERMPELINSETEGAFILIDIDDFKLTNDTYGHQTGDEVLIQVADLIKKSIRDTDIGTRWGGEELAIFLPKAKINVGKAVAERLVEKVRSETQPPVTISCGVSYWESNQDKKDTVKNLFKRADDALYSAKRSGKNKVVVSCESKKG